MYREESILSVVVVVTVSFFALPAQAQTTWHVDDDAPAGGTGQTWNTAFKYLQDALAAATASDEIQVAGGTYKPDQDEADPAGTGDRHATFQLISGVALYGGYRGCPDGNCGSGNSDERDNAMHETVLSGDLNGDDELDLENNNENTYHVVTGSDTEETAVLDGFTITAGNANGNILDTHGGGVYTTNGSPTLSNCTLAENVAADFGGGMYSGDGNPRLMNCTFTGNHSEGGQNPRGGGMYNDSGNPTLISCSFTENRAAGWNFPYGGGMVNNTGSPTLVDCTFSANVGGWGAGGMLNYTGSPTLIDCTFVRNTSTFTGGGFFGGGSPMLIRCGFHENSADSAGGMWNQLGNPTLIHCTFSGNRANRGGGMYNSNDGNATVIGCIFTGNVGGYVGGGMLNHYGSSPAVQNCIFTGNMAGGSPLDGNGGGMANLHGSAPQVSNCLFGGNTASTRGGAVYNDNGVTTSPTLGNSTFADNVAVDGGGIYHGGEGGLTITNSIFWQNRDTGGIDESAQVRMATGSPPPVEFSCVHGLVGACNGCIAGPPEFVSSQSGNWTSAGTYARDLSQVILTDLGVSWEPDTLIGKLINPDTGQWYQFVIIANTATTITIWADYDAATSGTSWVPSGAHYMIYDYRVQARSPCIDSADPDFVAEPNETDLDGHTRVLCGRVDMGAYEFGFGDYDCDRDVDLEDFANWSGCRTGPDDPPYPAGCEVFDFEYDGDVELDDYAGFPAALTGPLP